MTDFDEIRDLIIDYETNIENEMTKDDLLNEICKVCFAREIKEKKSGRISKMA